MDRQTRLGRVAALLALTLPTGCVSHRHSGGVASSEFMPDGPPVVVHHIGVVGRGCAPSPARPLRIDARSDERVFRVSNPGSAPIHFYYDWASSFGDYQMFFIRFVDGAGNLLRAQADECGWWSPKENHANLEGPGEWPERRRLIVPARGHIDIPIDQAALTSWWSYGAGPAARGPCAMQVRLFGYLARRTWESVTAETAWLPVPCPPASPSP